MDEGLEVVVGTYEHFLLGYTVSVHQNTCSIKPSFTNNSHCGSIRSICSIQKYIGSGSTDEVIRLLNLVSRTEHGTLQQQNGTITCLVPFHSYLFSGSDDGSICIWKTGSWQCEKTLRAHEGGVISIAVHPSGKMALSVGHDRTLKTWNLIKGRAGYTTNLKGIADAVQWSTEGGYYAVSINNRLDVYAVESAKIVYTLQHNKKINHVLFIQDDVCAIGGDWDSIQVHDVKKGVQLTTFTAHPNRVKDMKYLIKQKLLFTASNSDGKIKIWKFDEQNLATAPSLLTEYDTTCRITCMTVWDKSLLPKKSQMQILEENENSETEEMETEPSSTPLPPPTPVGSKRKSKEDGIRPKRSKRK